MILDAIIKKKPGWDHGMLGGMGSGGCSGDKEQFAGVRGAFPSPERTRERPRGAPDDDNKF